MQQQRVMQWVVVVLVIGGALALRLATFDRFLPFMDYTDETWYYGFAQTYRGNDDAVYWDRTAHSPPPLQAFVAAQIITLVDQFHDWELPATHTYYLRLWAVFMGTVTTAAIVAGGWRLGGVLAGVFAGFIWAFHPQIIDINSLMIADPYMFMLVALALMSAIVAWQTDSPWWLLASLLAGIGAIYSKFWVASAVFPFSVTALVLLWRNPRKMAGWMVVYALIAGVSAFYLLGIYDPLGTAQNLREADTFRNDGLRNAFNFDRWQRNWRLALYPIAQPLFYSVMALGLVAYADNWQRDAERRQWGLLLMLISYAVVSTMLSSTFTVARLDAGKIRHVMPTAIALMMVFGWALAQIHTALMARLDGGWLRRGAVAVLPLLVLGVHVPSMVALDVALVQNYRKIHPVQQLWAYTDSSLPREGLVWLDEGSTLATAWNRPWGGYAGSKPFLWWNEPMDTLVTQSPDDLIARDITHLMFTNKDEAKMPPAMLDFLDEMLLVKTLDIPEDDVFLWHNENLVGLNRIDVYRVMPPQVTVDVGYGDDIRMVGYDISADMFQAGDDLTVRFFWQANHTPPDAYSLFVHLYPSDEFNVLAQADLPPVSAERPTTTWDDSAEIFISEAVTLSLPDDLNAGVYRLAVGLYSYASGERLPSTDANGFHVIPLTVTD